MIKPQLMVSVDDHYPILIAYRGAGLLKKIILRFQEKELMERTRSSYFMQFFISPLVKFFGHLLHQLLLKKIYPKSDNQT